MSLNRNLYIANYFSYIATSVTLFKKKCVSSTEDNHTTSTSAIILICYCLSSIIIASTTGLRLTILPMPFHSFSPLQDDRSRRGRQEHHSARFECEIFVLPLPEKGFHRPAATEHLRGQHHCCE